MSRVKQKFSVTIGRKIWMSLTGLFLITFLVVHLVGNLQLLKNDGGMAFNTYTKFMTSNPLIKTTSFLLYGSILLHVIVSIFLTSQNKKARGPVAYKVSDAGANSPWNSRNMGILGSIILIFVVIHLQNFWYHMKFGVTPMVSYEGVEYKDLYTMVIEAFKEWWIVAIYVVSMIALGYHLNHGFQSAFQSLGINHSKYTPAIKTIGKVYSIVMAFGFAILPIIIFVQNL
ncbi:succinate dehydrogenase [Fulvitalea axinellae]|uniref:Succinate dehydrogenase n=1 Tax=Fulvitalea axinellae TaxID=1182444 RepID=A0AAU9D399_9BACT|nr:succinate dehydrogenase [Fulvitalea axinellae]